MIIRQATFEHLLRYCARPAFALERLSLPSGRDGSPERVRSTLPRHKRGQWVGPGRKRKATGPGQHGVIDLAPFEFLDRLAELTHLHDDRDAIQASPHDLPVIDIRGY